MINIISELARWARDTGRFKGLDEALKCYRDRDSAETVGNGEIFMGLDGTAGRRKGRRQPFAPGSTAARM